MTTIQISKTFGLKNYGSGCLWSVGSKAASQFVLSDDRILLDHMAVYGIISVAGSVHVKGVIYADSSGSPGALVAVTDEVTVTNHTAPQLIVLPCSASVTLRAGIYWLGIIWETVSGGASFSFTYAAIDNGLAAATDTYATPSDPYGTFTLEDAQISVYASYFIAKTASNMVVGKAVTTVSSNRALRFQEKMCFAAGRIWVVYVEGHSAYYTSSADDGLTWTTPVDLGEYILESGLGENVQLLNYGDRLHFMVRVPDVHYRSGIAAADGSIAWTAAWALVLDTGSFSYNEDFFMCLDSDGYPWMVQTMGDTTADGQPYVTRSSSNAGVWTTMAGYPVTIADSPTGQYYTNSFLVALSNGRIYAFYFGAGYPRTIKGKLWNGFSWGTEETVTTSSIVDQYPTGPFFLQCHETYCRGALVDDDDNIHFVFLDTGPLPCGYDPFSFTVRYVKRDLVLGWGAETVIASDVPKNACPAIVLNEGYTRIFWVNDPTGFICYRRIDDEGYMDKIVYLVDEQIATFPLVYNYGYDGLLNPFGKVVNDRFGMLWLVGASAPYTIKLGLQKYGYTVEKQQTREFEQFKSHWRKLLGNPSLSVTLSTLSLGSRDSVTGLYAKEYTDSTIEMVIVTKDAQKRALELGYFVQMDALGLTDSLVRVYDIITDSIGTSWLILDAHPIFLGDVFKFYKCDLKEMPLNVE